MKKFFLMSFFALSAVSMSAVAPIETSLRYVNPVDFESNLKNIIPANYNDMAQPHHAPAKVTDYESETWNLLGDGKYSSQAIAPLYGGSSELVDVTVYEAEGKPGLYRVLGVWPDLLSDGSGTLYIDATDPDFVIVEKQSTGIKDNINGDTYIASVSYIVINNYGFNKDGFLAEYGQYNAYVEDGVIHFPLECLQLQWPDAPVSGTVNPSYWYSVTSDEGLLILPGANYVDPWSEEIEATMVDNILSPTFEYSVMPYTVMVKKNFEKNIYRIIDPWRGLYDTLNLSGYTSPYIEIDATNPNNAIVPFFRTGIGGQNDGEYYIASASYYYESSCTEDRYVTVSEIDGNTVINFPINSMVLYASFTGKEYNGCPYDAGTITFKTIAGVDDITIDNNNDDAKVEYFNLQGVRVENPAAGQLVIKRQGSVVTKEIIR